MIIKRKFQLLALTWLASNLLPSQLQAEPVLIDRIAAIVDSDVIMQSELDERIEIIRRQTPADKLPFLSQLRKQVMDRMIEDSIQKQRADQIGLRITDDQLNDALNRMAAQNQMTLEQFRNTMEAQGVPFAQAREQIRDEMLVSRLQRIRVGERIQITDQDVDLFLASEVGKMASAAEYHLGHILVSTPSDATPADIQNAEAEAKQLTSQLKQGADFTKTAIAHSDGRNALKGGDLGWRKENQLPSLFVNIVPRMRVGEISNPIRSASGFHIVKILEKRGGSTQMVTQYQVRHILVRPNELRNEDQTRDLITRLYRQLQD
ncbi:MAG: peptidylprolyl isomerase, partial [Oceanobacter sp.]